MNIFLLSIYIFFLMIHMWAANIQSNYYLVMQNKIQSQIWLIGWHPTPYLVLDKCWLVIINYYISSEVNNDVIKDSQFMCKYK